MTQYEIRRPSFDDLTELTPRLRQQDRDELELLGSLLTPAALAALVSRDTYIGCANGRTVIAFGVLEGRLWFLASDELYAHTYALLRNCRPVVRALGARYPELTALAAKCNVGALRWLQWMGFRVVSEDESSRLLVFNEG